MKKDKTLKNAKDVFKTTLALASIVLQAEPTGIGKTMVDTVLFMVNELEKTVDNAENGRELLIDLKRLTDGLHSVIPADLSGTASADVQVHVNELLSELRRISDSCNVSKGNIFDRLVRRDEYAQTLLKVAPRLNEALQIYQTKATIRTELAVNQMEPAIGRMEPAIDKIKPAIERIEPIVHDLQRNSENHCLREILRPSATASHNSDREVAIGTCANGTRTQILDDIIEWALSDDPDSSVYLINGMAGLGKSTIAKTIAERADEGRYPHSRISAGKTLSHFKAGVLARSRDDEPADWMSIPLDVQLQRIYIILQSTTTFSHPTLIVLDAFDECDWPGSRTLPSLLLAMAFPRPPSKPVLLKFLITSRPEIDLISVFNRYCQRKEYVLHEMDKTLARNDIKMYLEQSLVRVSYVLNLGDLPPRWFDAADLEKLADAAGSLFIYAVTAIRIIEDRRVRDPEALLKSILAPKGLSSVQYPTLDALYFSILLPTKECADPELALERHQVVVGTLAFLRDRLSIAGIGSLLGMKPKEVQSTLVPLRSIIVVPSDFTQPPTIYHASFIDFITSSRCSEKILRLVPQDRERHLSICCLKTMTRRLAFNIAKIPNPGVEVSDIPDFAHGIPPEIMYSVRYWASHLDKSPHDQEIFELVDDFSSRCLLWWIEICGVLGYLDTAIASCRCVSIWLGLSISNAKISSLFNDASRLMMAHGSTLVSNPLQLYTSILAVIPSDTLLAQTYPPSTATPHLVVYVGRDHQWPGHLAAWTSHTEAITSVAFSPDGAQVVSGANDDTVRLWDVTLGRCTSVLEGHRGDVNSVAFSPNGMQLVSGSDDRTIRLWDVVLGSCTSVLEGHAHWVKSVVFSPDGTRVVSGSNDATVRLWDVTVGSCTSILEGRTGNVNSVAFSPHGTHMVSGSEDQTVRIWDVTLLSCTSVLHGHIKRVNSVAFSPDSKRVVSGSNDNTVRLWDVALGNCTSVLKGHTSVPGASTSVNSVAFSPDGMRVVSGANDKTARIWDVKLGCCISILEGHGWSVNSVMFSPDGMRAISGSDDITICVWDATVKSSHALPQGHTDWVKCVAFSPDGTRVVSGSDDQSVRIWDIKPGRCIAILEGHTYWVETVAFSPDGTRIVSGSADKTVRIWDVNLGSCIAILEGHNNVVQIVAFSSDGAHITSEANNETLKWHMDSDGCWHRDTSMITPQGSDASTAHTHLTSMSDWWLGHLNRDDMPTRICRLPSRIIPSSPIAFHGALVAAGSKDGTVTVLDASALLPPKTLQTPTDL